MALLTLLRFALAAPFTSYHGERKVVIFEFKFYFNSKFKITMIQLKSGTTLGYDEVIDTLSDAIGVASKVQAAVADGIGLSDIGTLIEITPTLNEIRLDAETFAAQFADLTAEESNSVANALVARHGGSPSNIVQKALAGLRLSARWQTVITDVIALVGETSDYAKGVFKKSPSAA